MTIPRTPLTAVSSIVRVVEGGGIIALPTDTVYGVAASVHVPAAVARLFVLKDRPVTTPLPVLIADLTSLAALDVTLDERATTVAGALWPGPLTIVVPATAELARLVGSPTDAVGVRIPDDDDVRSLLRATGPLCVTSANVHGAPPCHDADEVDRTFPDHGALDLVVDGGRRDGTVSTVLDLTGPQWRVVREGAIPASRLDELLDEV